MTRDGQTLAQCLERGQMGPLNSKLVLLLRIHLGPPVTIRRHHIFVELTSSKVFQGRSFRSAASAFSDCRVEVAYHGQLLIRIAHPTDRDLRRAFLHPVKWRCDRNLEESIHSTEQAKALKNRSCKLYSS
jgi:hypothetical protein